MILKARRRLLSSTPDAFFAAAEAEYPQAPVWSGELYLELHRATYTSQARAKAGNRRASTCCARPSCGPLPPRAGRV